MKKNLYRLAVLLLAFVSTTAVALAETAPIDVTANPISRFLLGVIQFINTILVPLLFAVAFIVFLWGIFQAFILGGADEEKRKEGKQFIVWGLVGFFVMVSVWGIVNLFVNSFGFASQTAPPIPKFNETTIRGGGGTDTFGTQDSVGSDDLSTDTGNDGSQSSNLPTGARCVFAFQCQSNDCFNLQCQ